MPNDKFTGRIIYGVILALILFILALPILVYKVFASTYGSNFMGGVCTASADNEYAPASNAFDTNLTTRWIASTGSAGHWLKCDLGVGASKMMNKVELTTSQRTKDIVIYGSNDNSTWTAILSNTLADNSGVKDTQTFYPTSSVAYRYFKYTPLNRYDANTDQDVYEWTGAECTDCGGGSTNTTTTQYTGFMSLETDQLLQYLLHSGIVLLVAWFIIKLFR